MKAQLEQARNFNGVLSFTQCKIRSYYQNEPEFNGVYLRNNLRKIKDGAYVINHDEFKSIEAHCIALFMNSNNIIYFNSFGF